MYFKKLNLADKGRRGETAVRERNELGGWI